MRVTTIICSCRWWHVEQFRKVTLCSRIDQLSFKIIQGIFHLDLVKLTFTMVKLSTIFVPLIKTWITPSQKKKRGKNRITQTRIIFTFFFLIIDKFHCNGINRCTSFCKLGENCQLYVPFHWQKGNWNCLCDIHIMECVYNIWTKFSNRVQFNYCCHQIFLRTRCNFCFTEDH